MKENLKKLMVIGAYGRMGEAICRLAKEEKRFEVASRVGKKDGMDSADPSSDVLIEFAHPSATFKTVQFASTHHKPLVIGTTGLEENIGEEIVRASAHIPIVYSPNFSIGMNVFFHLVDEAASLLDKEFDIEILEAHHRFKKDAPSGTAQKLIEILCEAKAKRETEKPIVQYGRQNMQSQRAPHEVGVHSVRAGDIVGEHTVFFGALGERIELVHRASNRDIFARGALQAAEWATLQKPGLYDMADVLGLK